MPLIHLNRLLVIFFFFPTFAYSDCKILNLIKDYKSKKSLEVCVFNKTSTGYTSKNCLDKKCKALDATKDAYLHFQITSHSNPAFEICQGSGGRPELFQINEGGQTSDQGICFFDKDKSYISTGLFLDLSHEHFEKSP